MRDDMNTTMDEIESLAKVHSGARSELTERVTALNDEITAIKRRRLQGIKNALERVRDSHEALRVKLAASRELFDNPKTRTFHNVRVGWQKQKGQILIEDEAVTVAALRRVLGEETAAGYIKVTEKPIRTALANLTAGELKKCGVTVTNDTDAVFIKATDSEVEKLVDALLGATLEETA